MISSPQPTKANTGARLATRPPSGRSRHALHHAPASASAAKAGMATNCGITPNQRAKASGMAEIQMIRGGLTSMTSTHAFYRGHPAVGDVHKQPGNVMVMSGEQQP